ncbi:MAG: response regulator [Oleiphilaceae bacterium]|nr:response regulator [Oleiphilaceae bacterium]
MKEDTRLADLQRRIRYWLPGESVQEPSGEHSIENLEADFSVLENQLLALFPERENGRESSALLQEQVVMRTVLDSMVEGVVVSDMEGNLLVFNQAARGLLGQKKSDSGPETWSEDYGFFHIDGKTPYASQSLPLSRALQGESVDDEELLVRSPANAQDCHISASARPLLDSARQQVGAVVVFHDITRSKQVEQELRKAREVAEASDRAKSEFLANMSHEIRTPLTAVLGFSDLLMDSNLGESDRLNYIQSIRRNGEHLLALISDVLDLSRINANKLRIEYLDCSLPNILHEAASVMQVRALDKNLTFELIYETPLPVHLCSDPTRVRQILLNLLSNAIKFTHEGGILVVARCLGKGSDRARVEVDVVDTGIGLSQEQRDLLFQPFHQANLSTTREYGGSGLGLAISRSLAEALGGDIRVHSTPGKGSTFTLVLYDEIPVDGEEVHEPGVISDVLDTSVPQQDPAGQLEGRILLAEDGHDNQILLATILRKQGLAVEIADNGQEAVEKALEAMRNQAPFDLILMDMQMPKLDGYGATAKLRAQDYSGPVVALTAHAMSGERERCVAAGCDDYLTKPIARQELIAAVASYLNGALGEVDPASPAPDSGDHSGPPPADSPLESLYAHDPEMKDLVAGFVKRLPGQLEAIQTAAEEDDLERLLRLVHQIKGAAGSYGFMPLSDEARVLENAAREARGGAEIRAALRRFSALCERVSRAGNRSGQSE